MRSFNEGDGFGCREATNAFGEREGLFHCSGLRDGEGRGGWKDYSSPADAGGCPDGAFLTGDSYPQTGLGSRGDGP